MNPLGRLIHGPGLMPENLRVILAGEDLIFLAERLTGSITYRRLRGPGQSSNWMREPATGAIGISSQRLVVWANRAKQMDMPHRHPLRGKIGVRLHGERKVVFGFELGLTNTAVSGSVEVRLKLEPGEARRVAGLLAAQSG